MSRPNWLREGVPLHPFVVFFLVVVGGLLGLAVAAVCLFGAVLLGVSIAGPVFALFDFIVGLLP